MHHAYGRGSVLLWQGDEIPREMGTFGDFLPHWQCIVTRSLKITSFSSSGTIPSLAGVMGVHSAGEMISDYLIAVESSKRPKLHWWTYVWAYIVSSCVALSEIFWYWRPLSTSMRKLFCCSRCSLLKVSLAPYASDGKIFTLSQVGVRSIAMSVSVCLSVRMPVRSRISKTARLNFTKLSAHLI